VTTASDKYRDVAIVGKPGPFVSRLAYNSFANIRVSEPSSRSSKPAVGSTCQPQLPLRHPARSPQSSIQTLVQLTPSTYATNRAEQTALHHAVAVDRVLCLMGTHHRPTLVWSGAYPSRLMPPYCHLSTRTWSHIQGFRALGGWVDLAEVSGVGVDFNPRTWNSRKETTDRLVAALANVERGYLRHVLLGSNKSAKGRVFQKLFSSLGYFRRSFRPLSRRAGIALRGVANATSMKMAAKDIYVARNSIVHTGILDQGTDLRTAQRAFTHCFLAIVEGLDRLPHECEAPIGAILND
jgi:hypothetical protein